MIRLTPDQMKKGYPSSLIIIRDDQSRDSERIAFAIVPVEVRYQDGIVGIALLLWSKQ